MGKYPYKVCCYCVHGVREEDASVGIPEHYVCDNATVPEEVYDADDFGSPDKDCPYFEPVIHEKCDVCGRTIDVPLWLWDKVYHGVEGDSVCCSNQCIANAAATEKQTFLSSKL